MEKLPKESEMNILNAYLHDAHTYNSFENLGQQLFFKGKLSGDVSNLTILDTMQIHLYLFSKILNPFNKNDIYLEVRTISIFSIFQSFSGT